MMKILVLISVLLFSITSFAAEKVNPFKLLKKEILLNEAKKMKKSTFSDELNKVKSRKEKQTKLIDKGIEWFQ